ncbi:MAG: metal ABC transporter permease [Streptosporangiales bacterium]
MDVLDLDFMRRALIAAVLVGLTAPSVGIYLVQRRMSLIGDGMGHIALTGVGIGLLMGQAPTLAALGVAIVGAVAVELVRVRGRTSGDIALALMFYGGIAGGVVLVSTASSGLPVNLDAYLFGAITTTSSSDLILFAVLAAVVLGVSFGLSRLLFACANDEEYARASGLPVLAVNIVLAVMTAVTVVVAMRVVGLLLVSALMIVPVALAQLVRGSFASTLVLATAIGVVVSAGGVLGSYYANLPSGGTIVLLAIGLFAIVAAGRGLVSKWVSR